MPKISSMFHEKGLPTEAFSMKRVIVFAFACGYVPNMAPAMGWPYAMLGIFIIIALPAIAIFESKGGPALLAKLIDRLGKGSPGRAKGALEAIFQKQEWEVGDPDEGIL